MPSRPGPCAARTRPPHPEGRGGAATDRALTRLCTASGTRPGSASAKPRSGWSGQHGVSRARGADVLTARSPRPPRARRSPNRLAHQVPAHSRARRAPGTHGPSGSGRGARHRRLRQGTTRSSARRPGNPSGSPRGRAAAAVQTSRTSQPVPRPPHGPPAAWARAPSGTAPARRGHRTARVGVRRPRPGQSRCSLDFSSAICSPTTLLHAGEQAADVARVRVPCGPARAVPRPAR